MKRILKKNLNKNNIELNIKFLLLAFIINLSIEILSRNSIKMTLVNLLSNPVVFLYNTLIVLFTLSFGFLTRRRTFIWIIVASIWIGFGITNNILLRFRTTPFTAVDFSLVTEALPMVNIYLTTFQITLIIIGIIIFIIGVFFCYRHIAKDNVKINYFKASGRVIIILILIIVTTKLGIKENFLADTFGNLADAYNEYGFAYCFANSLINTGIDKPDEYSPEVIDELVKDTMAMASDKEDKKNPNIIMVQLESFFDPTCLVNAKFSKDPIPNFHKLEEEFSSGFLTVPSVGAGTANTEFEAITGMSLKFFGPGEYPYKTVLKNSTCESVCYNLKDIGYNTHAIHNNDGTFYGRHLVFSNLGFDTFTSIEYMNPIERNPMGWAKDNMLIKEIYNTLESTSEKDFIYTISVQGHGKYPKSEEDTLSFTTSEADNEEENQVTDKNIEKEHRLDVNKLSNDGITVEGIDEEYDYPFEYYVNQIHEMDEFLGNLINKLSSYDEDVVVVFYGDHLPGLGIKEENLKNKSIFQTPYVIWNNFGNEKRDKELYSYQLMAEVLRQVGIDNGILTKLHQRESKKNTYLSDLKLLQYDMLYGKKEVYGEKNPFEPTRLKMGIDEITIKDVVVNEDSIKIKGENFTEYSKVLINDSVIETIYVGSNIIEVKDKTLKTGDVVKVAQIGNDNNILSTTTEYTIE